MKNVCMFILKTFCLTPYKQKLIFYEQFEEQAEKAKYIFFEIRIQKKELSHGVTDSFFQYLF